MIETEYVYWVNDTRYTNNSNAIDAVTLREGAGLLPTQKLWRPNLETGEWEFVPTSGDVTLYFEPCLNQFSSSNLSYIYWVGDITTPLYWSEENRYIYDSANISPDTLWGNAGLSQDTPLYRVNPETGAWEQVITSGNIALYPQPCNNLFSTVIPTGDDGNEKYKYKVDTDNFSYGSTEIPVMVIRESAGLPADAPLWRKLIKGEMRPVPTDGFEILGNAPGHNQFSTTEGRGNS